MLFKLYEAATASALEGLDLFSNAYPLHYIRALDCAVYMPGGLNSIYKFYRDGSVVRYHTDRGYYYQYCYWHEEDAIVWVDIFNAYGKNLRLDPMGFLHDVNSTVPLTANLVTDFTVATTIWNGSYYRPTGSTVQKRSMSGTVQSTITVTGTQTFSADRAFITQSGKLVVIDFDNGTYGVARFYDLTSSTMLYEAVFDRSFIACVDTVHEHIWALDLTTKKMKVWSFLIAPQNFSAITMSANRARYREDTLSVTLRGSLNEPVPNWPVSWALSTGEGRLEKSYTVTDASGVTTNRYFGPGVDDFVGGSQTITVSTGY